MVQAPRGLALVTGAAVRVGRAIALHLADLGFDIIGHVRGDVARLDDLHGELRMRGRALFRVSCDLADGDAVRALGTQLVQDHRTVDVVVHCAAMFEKIPFADIDAATYHRMQAVNVDAPFFLTQALLPALQNAKAPVVVHLVDIAAERPYNERAHYSVSKAGLAMLTKALARELAPHIRVVGVSPGVAIFPDDYTQAMRDAVIAKVPLAREGTPEDIAAAVGYLVDAHYVTGVIVAVDGGRSVVP